MKGLSRMGAGGGETHSYLVSSLIVKVPVERKVSLANQHGLQHFQAWTSTNDGALKLFLNDRNRFIGSIWRTTYLATTMNTEELSTCSKCNVELLQFERKQKTSLLGNSETDMNLITDYVTTFFSILAFELSKQKWDDWLPWRLTGKSVNYSRSTD